jgi:hypothetical protein
MTNVTEWQVVLDVAPERTVTVKAARSDSDVSGTRVSTKSLIVIESGT